MEEKQLEILFRQFLLTKGYPASCMLSQVPLRITGDRVFRPDLLIIDINRNEYIALIEFKSIFDRHIEVNALRQFYKYFNILGTIAIPSYLVFPSSEYDFQILILTKDNSFERISKDDFPDYETLSAKRRTEEKLKLREIKEKTLLELEQKKKRGKLSAYFAILSLILGITSSLVAIFIQQNGLDKPKSEIVVYCCDSLETKYEQLLFKIENIEKRITTISSKKIISDTVLITKNVSDLEKRMKQIELGISENPEKTLSILQIRQEIELLKQADNYSKELTQSKLDALKDEMEIQNAWMLGVLIAIFGTILSLVIPNLLARRIDSTVNLKDSM